MIILRQPGCIPNSPFVARTIERQKRRLDEKHFCRHLDFSATEASVRTLIERYGNVDRVNLVTDRDTGRPRGFAFVEMTDAAQADRAITELNGMDLDGRALNVNEARPKPQGGGFGGGSFRGNRGGGPARQRREPRW